MQKIKDTIKKGKYVTGVVIFLTLIISLLFVAKIQKSKTINLNSGNISVIDDRVAHGESIAQFIPTNQGLEFACQINNSHLEQPYCKLSINIQDLNQQAPFTGMDLSSYNKIGLWIKHNHSTQPGTRIELHNFNPAYSVANNVKSLKQNALEYLEAYVTNPVWLDLHSFSVPQWWSNANDLAQTHGGTDFSNIYSIVISPSIKVQEGSYKLTIEKIEVRGDYISESALISMLIIIWSFGLGYLLRRTSSPKPIQVNPTLPAKQAVDFGAMNDPLTGALNRIGLRKCFDKLTPSDLKNLSLIFLNIDHFENMNANYGKQVTNKVLQQLVQQINATCRTSDTIIRWDNEEFLLVCPDTKLAQAVGVVDKIKLSIKDAKWPNNLEMSCSSGVAQMYDEDLNNLIIRAKKALYSVKNTGENKTAAA